VIPGPRPPKGHDRPAVGRDRSRALRPARPHAVGEVPSATHHAVPHAVPSPAVPSPGDPASDADDQPLVALVRSPKGWAVVSPAGRNEVGDLIEGLSLADLVVEEFGVLPEPDRSARRSARGPADAAVAGAVPIVDARVAALERTVAQLEHALAARVATERAIGVLAERQRSTPRAAFEELRRDARSQGRPVAELAREVLESLPAEAAAVEAVPPAGAMPPPRDPVPPTAAPVPTTAADGGS
jgi:ANTAR domain